LFEKIDGFKALIESGDGVNVSRKKSGTDAVTFADRERATVARHKFGPMVHSSRSHECIVDGAATDTVIGQPESEGPIGPPIEPDKRL
jgi:hypothetical protein